MQTTNRNEEQNKSQLISRQSRSLSGQQQHMHKTTSHARRQVHEINISHEAMKLKILN